jgi:hypothetical protein
MAEGSGKTVLVVEDDPGVAKLQQRCLERAGYHVTATGTAEEALERVEQGGVALVVLDYRLPGGRTGLDLYAQLRATSRDLPVILVTGFGDEATVILALRAGVRDFVTKSAEYLDYLPEAVRRVLKQVDTERLLVESEARLAAIISSAKDAILTVEADQCISLFNPAAEQTFGCPAVEATGQPVGRFLRPLAGAPVNGRLGSNGTDQGGHHALYALQPESRGVRADGTEFPLEVSVAHVQTSAREFYTLLLRDISQRKRAEEQLREQATLLSKATDAIVVWDLHARIVYWNQGAERLYGWTAQEATGKVADRLLFQGVCPELEEARELVLRKGEWTGELRQVTRAAKEVFVQSRWTLVRDDDGQPKCLLVVNSDVTEKKRLEAQYLRAQRMESIGTLAAGIAHDLNNVLTPIMMGVDLLRSPLPESARQSVLASLQASAERGAGMVKQVLSFARGVEGRRVEIQPRHVIREIAKMLRQTLPKAIDVKTSWPDDLWSVTGDATQLHQVLMNLCVNARDAMPDGGVLTIAADNVRVGDDAARMHFDAKPGSYVLLTVADTGTGIPADILGKVFDPFFSTKEPGKGTGLGLSTVLGIVKSHDGFVNVQSEAGKGSQFSAYFPAVETGLPERAQKSNEPLPCGSGELILVVDDEASIRDTTQATLEAHGYRVISARDGSEAVALYAQHRDDVQAVLTDMTMPVMSGRQTVRVLQRLDPTVRIVAVSGLAADGSPPDIATLGVQAFLPKPYTAGSLLNTLHAVLGSRRDRELAGAGAGSRPQPG